MSLEVIVTELIINCTLPNQNVVHLGLQDLKSEVPSACQLGKDSFHLGFGEPCLQCLQLHGSFCHNVRSRLTENIRPQAQVPQPVVGRVPDTHEDGHSMMQVSAIDDTLLQLQESTDDQPRINVVNNTTTNGQFLQLQLLLLDGLDGLEDVLHNILVDDSD